MAYRVGQIVWMRATENDGAAAREQRALIVNSDGAAYTICIVPEDRIGGEDGYADCGEEDILRPVNIDELPEDPVRRALRLHKGHTTFKGAQAAAAHACAYLAEADAYRRRDGKFIPLIILRADQHWMRPRLSEYPVVLVDRGVPLPEV